MVLNAIAIKVQIQGWTVSANTVSRHCLANFVGRQYKNYRLLCDARLITTYSDRESSISNVVANYRWLHISDVITCLRGSVHVSCSLKCNKSNHIIYTEKLFIK